MFGLRRLFIIAILAAAAIPSARAVGEWFHPHKDSTNNAAQPFTGWVQDINVAPLWTSTVQNLAGGASPTVLPPFVFHPAHNTDAGRVTLKALNAETGGLFWESPSLDVENTIDFGSLTSASADPADRSVYFAAGNTIYKLNAADGSIVWDTELTAANTTPGLSSYEIINSSPALGGGMVFIETYGGFVISNKQIVALNQADGAVAWFQNDQGRGASTPIYAEVGGQPRVYSVGDLVVNCYQAGDGTPVWNSATANDSWVAPADVWGSPTYAGGNLYVGSTDFSATTTLICADAATGDLNWEVPAPAADVPPIVMDGKVYVYGGGSPGVLAAFDVQTGAAVFNQPVNGGFVFRDYMAAAQDAIYLCGGGEVVVVDPADGTEISRKTDAFSGPVTIDQRGGVYVHNGDVLEAYGLTIPVELSRFMIE